MYTEKQAKKLWCPATRHSRYQPEDVVSDPPVNRHDDYHNPNYARCIASQCMWWRWEELTPYGKSVGHKPEHGWCGIAGEPK